MNLTIAETFTKRLSYMIGTYEHIILLFLNSSVINMNVLSCNTSSLIT